MIPMVPVAWPVHIPIALGVPPHDPTVTMTVFRLILILSSSVSDSAWRRTIWIKSWANGVYLYSQSWEAMASRCLLWGEKKLGEDGCALRRTT